MQPSVYNGFLFFGAGCQLSLNSQIQSLTNLCVADLPWQINKRINKLCNNISILYFYIDKNWQESQTLTLVLS